MNIVNKRSIRAEVGNCPLVSPSKSLLLWPGAPLFAVAACMFLLSGQKRPIGLPQQYRSTSAPIRSDELLLPAWPAAIDRGARLHCWSGSAFDHWQSAARNRQTGCEFIMPTAPEEGDHLSGWDSFWEPLRSILSNFTGSPHVNTPRTSRSLASGSEISREPETKALPYITRWPAYGLTQCFSHMTLSIQTIDLPSHKC